MIDKLFGFFLCELTFLGKHDEKRKKKTNENLKLANVILNDVPKIKSSTFFKLIYFRNRP